MWITFPQSQLKTERRIGAILRKKSNKPICIENIKFLFKGTLKTYEFEQCA